MIPFLSEKGNRNLKKNAGTGIRQSAHRFGVLAPEMRAAGIARPFAESGLLREKEESRTEVRDS
jgi:hypothetical protein